MDGRTVQHFGGMLQSKNIFRNFKYGVPRGLPAPHKRRDLGSIPSSGLLPQGHYPSPYLSPVSCRAAVCPIKEKKKKNFEKDRYF